MSEMEIQIDQCKMEILIEHKITDKNLRMT